MRRVRIVLLGGAANRRRLEPRAHVVPSHVRQPHEPRARVHVPRAVRRAHGLRAEDGERVRLRVLAPGVPLDGQGGDGRRTEVLRRRRAGRRRADEEHVAGAGQRAFHRGPAQTVAAQFRGHRRHPFGAAETVAARKSTERYRNYWGPRAHL